MSSKNNIKSSENDDPKHLAELEEGEEEEDREEEEDEEDDDDDDDDVTTRKTSKSRRSVMMSGAADDEDDEDDDDEDEEEEEEDENRSMDDTGMGKSSAPSSAYNFGVESDEEEDEEYDQSEDEQYLQKFEENMKTNVIRDHHPEMMVQNYDEIELLSRVVRDQHGRIVDPLHQSLPFVTKYEKTRVLGERARQINAGATPFVVVESGVIEGYLIALKEFQEKKIPFILKRPIAGNHIEYWKLSDLEII